MDFILSKINKKLKFLEYIDTYLVHLINISQYFSMDDAEKYIDVSGTFVVEKIANYLFPKHPITFKKNENMK